MKRFNYIKMLVSIFVVLTFVSCTNESSSSKPIKIGINSWAGYDPFIVADKAEIFNKHDVDVEIIRYSSTVEEIQAMIDGKIQGGGFTLDEVFTLVEAGVTGKIVLIVDYSKGGDMIIGQKDIKSVHDLIGKNVGYEGTVVGEFLLQRALEENMIKKNSIELININADKWLTHFKEKKVDALVCFNPVSDILLDEYAGNLLFSSSDIPFEIIDVLFISDKLAKNKEKVEKILKSWFATLTYMDSKSQMTENIVSKVKDITPVNFKNGLKGLKFPNYNLNISIMDAKSDKNIYKYSQKIVDFMLTKGLLSNRINTTNLFDSTSLKNIKASK